MLASARPRPDLPPPGCGPRRLLDRLGRLLGRLGRLLGALERLSGALERLLARLGPVLGCSWPSWAAPGYQERSQGRGGGTPQGRAKSKKADEERVLKKRLPVEE